MSVLPCPRAVVFDWDNTLVDSWGAIYAALCRTLTHMGLEPWPEEEARVRSARSMRDYFPETFGDRWEEARDVYYASFDDVFLKDLRTMPGAVELVEYLRGESVPMGVLSNKRGRYLRAEAEKLGWRDWFFGIVGAGDAQEDKPAKISIKTLLDSGSFESGEGVWLVGDTHVDMQCAHEYGCIPVFLTNGGANLPDSCDYKAKKSFTDCSEMTIFVQELFATGEQIEG